MAETRSAEAEVGGGGSAAGAVREALARYLGPALLLVVALGQIHLAYVRDLLTPARGGGFGLFSTVDKMAHRQVRMAFDGPDGTAKVGLPAQPGIVKLVRNAASLPTDETLRFVAKLLDPLGRTVAVEGQPPFPLARVEVWKPAFDQQTLEARRVLVNRVVVEREP